MPWTKNHETFPNIPHGILNQGHPRFTLLHALIFENLKLLTFVDFFCVFEFFDTKLTFKVSKSFYKLSRSLSVLKSPWITMITTIQLTKKFEMKVKIATLR